MKKIFCLVIFVYLLAPAFLTAQEKPLLSVAIKKEINTNGIEAAKKHFAKEYKSNKNGYNVDMKGISSLATEYSQAKNYTAASAVMEIASPYMQDMVTSYMGKNTQQMMKAEKGLKEKERQDKKLERQKYEKNRIIEFEGEPRKDLERFTGLYGDPAVKDKTRRFWVAVSCDGYLVIGAMWGDVAPWWMRSVNDKVFTYSDSFNNLRMEFVTDNTGKAIKMIHDIKSMKTPLERVGPLPDNMKHCIERPKR